MANLSVRLTPPNKNSASNEWISWYDQLESNFGGKDARTAFTVRWGLVKPDAGNDNSLRTYMEGKGIKIEAGGVFGTVEDSVKDFTGGLGNIFKMGAISTYIIGIVILVFALIIIYRLAKPEAVGTIIKYAK